MNPGLKKEPIFFRWRLAGFAPAALIVLAAAYAYYPALRGGWLWDDDMYITENPALRVPGAWWKIWVAPSGVNYFPVTATVQWCQWRLWGDHTLGYHATNIVLHLFGAFLLWRLLNRLGFRRGWLGALLFAVHPVAVESIAWIAEIKNALSLPLLLLSCSAFVDFDSERAETKRLRVPLPETARPGVAERASVSSGGRRSYLFAILFFLAAMLSKSTVVMFPVLLLLYAWWKHGRVGRAAWWAAAPFFGISLALGGVSVWFEHHRAMAGSTETFGHPAARLAAAFLASSFYLCKGFCPVRLLAIYPRWSIAPATAAPWLAILAVAAPAAWIVRRRSRGAILGFGWFGLNLVPVLGLVPMAYQFFSWSADHFAYISLVGLCGLAAGGAEALRRAPAPWAWAGGLAVAAALAVLAQVSHETAGAYRDGLTLWSRTLRSNPDSWAAHENLGAALAKAGRYEEAIGEYGQALALHAVYPDARYNLGIALTKTGHWREAIASYREAVRLQPRHAKAWNNLGSLLEAHGQVAEAEADFEEALRIDRSFASAHNNLGMALARKGRLEEALDQYRRALEAEPDLVEAHNNRGNALAAAGRRPEAMAEYRAALQLEPNLPETHFNLGNALSDSGRNSEAIAEYEEALRLRPVLAAAEVNLGDVLASQGRPGEALAHLRRAAVLAPESAVIHFDLGNQLLGMGRPAEAAAEYRTAIRLDPGLPQSHNNLGNALMQQGLVREAVEQYRQALAIAPGNADAQANLSHALRLEGGRK